MRCHPDQLLRGSGTRISTEWGTVSFSQGEERHECHGGCRHNEECGRYFVACTFHQPSSSYRGDRDRGTSCDDGDDAANCDGDGYHSGHLCRIASHVGNGSNPDFPLGGRTSASAECRHWSGRAVCWSPLGVGAFFSEGLGLAMTATTPRPHCIVYVSGITRTPPRQ